ncbi:MAG: MBL fold metallo-hydrolase [Thermodesulfobacteriota bacterium]|nr:MBL fold metallo-hydrolase [Thermodesulfobacteriota bacterium]
MPLQLTLTCLRAATHRQAQRLLKIAIYGWTLSRGYQRTLYSAAGRSVKVFEISLSLIIVLFILSCAFKPRAFDETEWRKKVESPSTEKLYSPHFKDGKYFNPWMPMEGKQFREFLRWRFSRKDTYTDDEQAFRANIQPHLNDRINELSDEEFIAWIGHGTFLIRIQAEYWLTDPIFSKRALLPARVTPSAISTHELSELTTSVNVLISHNHYDHLDVKSIRSLPEKARIYVPLGLKKYVEEIHEGEVRELDWWESVDLESGTKLVCLPAQHWSRRIGQPRNSTLWASYILITPRTSIYYGGDSGYFLGYKEIGRIFPGIGYALLPVTAYHPRWFMHYSHMNAAEVLDAFQDLGARYFIPTQWGTFQLGDNPPGYPALDLMKTIQKKGFDPSRFIIMDIGEIRVLSEPGRTTP